MTQRPKDAVGNPLEEMDLVQVVMDSSQHFIVGKIVEINNGGLIAASAATPQGMGIPGFVRVQAEITIAFQKPGMALGKIFKLHEPKKSPIPIQQA